MKDTANQRLKTLIGVLREKRMIRNQQEFNEVVGLNKTITSEIVNGKRILSEQYVRLIAASFPVVSAEWLLTGEGEMIKAESALAASGKKVPFYDIDVTASITESFNDLPEVPQYYIDFPPLGDCTAAFPVYGESMEPDFFAGEVVLVKEITNVDSMLWGEPYLVITNSNCDNLRTIKNVYLSDDRTKFILRATNPRYTGDTLVPLKDVLKIFLVKGKVNRRQL